MKRIISLVLVITLLFSLTSIFAYADNDSKTFTPPGLAKKGGMPPGLAKKFLDLDRFEWAKNAIEKMAEKGIIKGIGDDLFAPANSVTKVEALAMIIRTMGWDEDAEALTELIKKGKKEDKLKDKVTDWGKGYIEMAVEKGLINEIDLLQSNFSTPATRQEVAKYIIRAMGLENEAQKHMEKVLNFKDVSAIQIGSVGYVYLVNQLGIMVGDTNNTFQPNKPVNRAEMATLASRMYEQINKETIIRETKVLGSLVAVGTNLIIVKTNNKLEAYELDSSVKVFINDKLSTASNLETEKAIELTIKDGKVITINARYIAEQKTKGTLVTVESGKIVIRVDKDLVVHELDSAVKVYINEKLSRISNLETGKPVELIIKDGKVVTINATYVVETKVVGTLVTADSSKVVVRVNNSLTVYDMDTNVKVYVNDQLGRLADLQTEKAIELTINNDKVIAIRANYQDSTYDYSGNITNIYNSTKKITVKSSSSTKTFDVTGDTIIRLDGTASSFNELVVGMKVDLRIVDNVLTRVYAESLEESFEGTLVKIEGGTQNKITVKTGSTEKTFTVETGSKIYIDDKEATFAELFNYYNKSIKVETKNSRVTNIYI